MIIKHGPYHVSVHPCRVALKNESKENVVVSKEKENEVQHNELNEKLASSNQQKPNEIDERKRKAKEKVVTVPWPASKRTKTESNEDSDSESEEQTSTETSNEIITNEDEDLPRQMNAKKDLTKGAVVSVNVEGLPDKWQKVELTSRAAKATGKYKNAWNVKECESGKEYYVDLNRVQWSHENQAENNDTQNPPTPEECLVSSDVARLHKESVANAKMKELDGWKVNNVYKEVEDVGQERISVRWVTTEKVKNDEVVVKARLCARGFEEVQNFRKDSPTCSRAKSVYG